MNIEEFRSFCLSMKGVTEGLPFDHNTLVFKVSGKIFAITDLDEFVSINLKCDPERAIALREQFPEVQPGYHMNKKHWNTVDTNGKIPDSLLQQWIRDSYDLVVSGLSKKQREILK